MKALRYIILLFAALGISLSIFSQPGFAQGTCDTDSCQIENGPRCSVNTNNCASGYIPRIETYGGPFACTNNCNCCPLSQFCKCECRKTTCGDGEKQCPNGNGQCEECDDGNTASNDRCNACVLTVCGDGITQNPNGHDRAEECDDGNSNNNDGCTDQCLLTSPPITSCGDGVIQSPNSAGQNEQCDNGGNNGACPKTCSTSCTNNNCPVGGDPCGNGVIDPGEECDGTNFGGKTCQTFEYSCGSLGCGTDDRGNKCQIFVINNPGTCSNSCNVDSCPGGCNSPPAATCSGSNRITYSSPGTCSSGTCSYSSSSTNCPYGCSNGVCNSQSDLCSGVTCNSPPANTCTDSNTLKTYSSPGTCNSNTGVCSYSSSTQNCPYGCSSGACLLQSSDTEAPIGSIDNPNGVTVSGTVYANGWALDQKSAVSSVTVHVDNYNGFAKDYSTSVCGSRADVCNVYGAPYSAYSSCPDRCSAGWSAAIDTSQMPDGGYDVTAKACDSNNNCGSLSGSPRRMTVSNPTCTVSIGSNVQNNFWVKSPSGTRYDTGLVSSYSRTFSGSDVKGTWDMGEYGHDSKYTVSVSPSGSQSCASGSVHWSWTYTEKSILSVSKDSFSFSATQGGSNPPSDTLTITNTGVGYLSWSVSDNAAWLTLSRSSGTEGAGASSSPPVTLSVDIAGLSTGTYDASMAVRSNGGDRDIPVRLTISAPATCKVSVSTGKNGPSVCWTLTTPGGNVRQCGSSNTYEGPRGTYDVNVDPSSVPSNLVFDRKDPSGSQDCNLAKPPDYAILWLLYFKDKPTDVPILSVSKSSFSFSATQGSSNPASDTLTITNIGTSLLSWSVSDNAAWLDVRRSLSGQETSGTEGASASSSPPLTVSASIAGMSAGTYTGSISVSSNGGNASIPVTLTISTVSTTCTIRITSDDSSSCHRVLRGGSVVLTTQCVNVGGGTIEISGQPTGNYDLQLESYDTSYTFERYDPTGSQQCGSSSSSGTVSWTAWFKKCGNNKIEGVEQCDNGGSNGLCPATCSSSCTNNNCIVDTAAPIGSIDTPNGDTWRGTQLSGGWALDESGVGSVTVKFRKTDGAVSKDYSTSVCGNRPDVCGIYAAPYQSYSACGGDRCKAGWNTLVDTIQLSPGSYSVYATAIDAIGKSRDLDGSPRTVTINQCYQTTCTAPAAQCSADSRSRTVYSCGSCDPATGVYAIPSTVEQCIYGCSAGQCNPNTGPSIVASHSPASPGTSDQVTITATASDIDGVSSTVIFVDGAARQTCAGATCAFTATHAYGTHPYHATATDTKGLSSQSATQSFTSNDAPSISGPISYTGSCNSGSTITLKCNANDANQVTNTLNVRLWAGQCVGSNCFATRSWATGSGTTYYNGAAMDAGNVFTKTLTITQPDGTAIAATCRATDERGAQNPESQGDAYPLCVVGQCQNPAVITINSITPNPARTGMTVSFTADRALQGDPIMTVKPGSQAGGTQEYPAAFVSKSVNSYTYSFDILSAYTNGISDILIKSSGQNCPANKVDNSLVIDTIPPTTSALCNNALCSSRVYAGQTTLTFSCSDATTRCVSTSYSIDNGVTATYNPAAPPVLQAGQYTVRFFSTDIAGNTEGIKASTVRVYSGNDEAIFKFAVDRKSAVTGETVNGKLYCFLRDRTTKLFTRECNIDPSTFYITVDKGTPAQKNYFTYTGIAPSQFLTSTNYYYTTPSTINYDQYQYYVSKEWRMPLDTNIFHSDVCAGGQDQDSGLNGEGCDGFSVSNSQLLSNTTFPDVQNLVVPLTPGGAPNFTKTMLISFRTAVSVRSQLSTTLCDGADCSVNFSFIPFDQWGGIQPHRAKWDSFSKAYVPDAGDVSSSLFACDSQRTLFIRATKLTGSDAGISNDETRNFFINCNIRATVNPSEKRLVLGDTPGKIFDVSVWNPKEGIDRVFSVESTTTNPDGYPLAWINFDCASAVGCSVDQSNNDKATLTVPQVSSRTVQVHMPSAVRSGSFPVVFQATDGTDGKKYSATGTILIFAESLDEFAAWQLIALGAAAVAIVYFATDRKARKFRPRSHSAFHE